MKNRRKSKSHKEYINELRLLQPDLHKEIIFLSKYESQTKKILIQDKYGVLSVLPTNLLKGYNSIRSAIDKDEYLRNMLLDKNIHYTNNEFTIVGKVSINSRKVIVEDKYGRCIVDISGLLKGCNTSILTAIDKNEYFKNQATEIHGYKYNYDKVQYQKQSAKVTITCNAHGDFLQTPNAHLRGSGCRECSDINNAHNRSTKHSEFVKQLKAINGTAFAELKFLEEVVGLNNKVLAENKYGKVLVTPQNLLSGRNASIRSATDKTLYFKNQAIEIHGDSYDYSKSVYEGCKTKLAIICPKHGEFRQSPQDHLKGCGCPTCGMKISCGFTKESWISAGIKSKGENVIYKMYFARIWDDYELFYKVGITFRDVDDRFCEMGRLYNYEILKVIDSNDGEFIWNLEQEYHKENKVNHIVPNKKFGGSRYECYSLIELGGEDE